MDDKPAKPVGAYDLFQQTTWWQDIGGTWHELATMDPRHRDNLLPFLRRRAKHYRDAASHAAIRLFYDAPDDVYEAAMDEFDTPTDEAWLEATPLARELRRYEEERSPVGKLRTKSHNRTYRLRKWLGWARS